MADIRGLGDEKKSPNPRIPAPFIVVHGIYVVLSQQITAQKARLKPEV
jgi:hypothetical protein